MVQIHICHLAWTWILISLMTDSLTSEVYNHLHNVLTFISTQRPKQHSTYFSGLSGYFILISWFFVTFFSNISNILLRDPTSRASTYKKLKKTKFTIKNRYCPVTTKLLLVTKILPPVKQKKWWHQNVLQSLSRSITGLENSTIK